MSRGGDGSHWADCREVHIDCANAEIERLLETIREIAEMAWAANDLDERAELRVALRTIARRADAGVR